MHLYHPVRTSRPEPDPSPRRSNKDLFIAMRPVERFAVVVIDPELVIVDTVGAQPINLLLLCKKYRPVVFSVPQALPVLTYPQALNMVPGCVKILLDAQRWVHNGVGQVKAIIIVYSRPTGSNVGFSKS